MTDEDGEVRSLVPEGRDISEQTERERTLQKYKRRFEAISADPNLLVGLLDGDGTVVDVNETALEYVDTARQSIVGQPFWEAPWWTGDYRTEVRQWISDAAAGEYVEYEAVHLSDDDEQLMVDGNFRPVADEDGNVVRIVVSAKDITEQRQRERELKRRNERFDEFASFVSHDLQRPLSTVRGRLELALETGDLEHVEKAADAIDRVDGLRNDLVTTLRTGEIVAETEPVDFETVLEGV